MIEMPSNLEMDEAVRWGELKRTILLRLARKMALLTHPAWRDRAVVDKELPIFNEP